MTMHSKISSLPNELRDRVQQWRRDNYVCDFSSIPEILEYNFTENENGEKVLKYLRKAQFEALETYWYLRLVEGTPQVLDLYEKMFKKPTNFLKSLGIPINKEEILEIILSDDGINTVLEKIRTDDTFVKKFKLQTVRETLTLNYPSYILALAMGAGKTFLIGAIIATEFAMAMEYPSQSFVKNALVFAPGKTILGALKEISDTPFEKILPPRFYKTFLSTVKITYTQDGEKDIPVIAGSTFNVIVTNTEKIRIQKSTKKREITLLNFKQREKLKEEEETVNLRLQKIASLPDLAIFSDEAHHTYGRSLDRELKKVRKTVDYIAENTDVIVVVNTTGTPYYRRQMLRDVVYWYSLSEGIRDGILKEVSGNIVAYSDIESADFVKLLIKDFFQNYGDVTLYDGRKAKLAIYFPQTDDLKKMKPVVEQQLLEIKQDPSIVLEVHNKSSDEVKDLFNNRIRDPFIPYRIFLLVNMGTEGWDCPSLFATALARKLKSSNNFVLQAASRCLRQVPGNNRKAKIYLSKDNRRILDAQLKETFGEDINILYRTLREMKKERVILRKIDVPPVLIKKKVKRVVVKDRNEGRLSLEKPTIKVDVSQKTTYKIGQEIYSKGVLVEATREEIALQERFADVYEVAIELSSLYRLKPLETLELLDSVYPNGEIPMIHIPELKKQIEDQIRNYAVEDEEIEVALAIVKREGFNRDVLDGETVYTTEIIYHKDKGHLLSRIEEFKAMDFSFHYTPYKFDSYPEKDFFTQLLENLNEDPDDVDDVYFIGAFSDPKKTDFLFEYQDKKGKWRVYNPDFLIRKKDGKVLIVEIKGKIFKDIRKEMAMKAIEGLNPDRIKYEILLTSSDEIGFENVNRVKEWIYNE